MSKTTSAADWVSQSGEFERPDSSFRDWITENVNAKYPPEKGRYHLYVAYSCPWAHRALIVLKLKGLEEIVSFTAMHWLQDEKGWRFATAGEQDSLINMTLDPHHDESVTHLQDIYYEIEPNYQGRFTTPTLYDTKTKQIVNNESADIIRMLNRSFDTLLPDRYRKLDLYPTGLQCDIDLINGWTYTDLNNGVYKAGFATSQGAYETAVYSVFKALDRIENQLKSGSPDEPFIFGNKLTETDVRLFTTIIRFDVAYVQHFKCNIRHIRSGYPSIHRWLRRLFWTQDAFRSTTNFEHIKKNYMMSQTHVNPSGIVAAGPVPNVMPLDGGF